MPTVKQHQDQGRRNAEVAELLHADGNYKEWAVVALFYQALHHVNLFFLHHSNIAPANHKERQKYVELMLRDIAGEYDELYRASREARYDCRRYGDRDVVDLQEAALAIRAHISTSTSLAL